MVKNTKRIPKVIHYCWFGGNELSESAMKCIDSWKKYCPDYEIIEWNESNFDINISLYTREAYKEKKWAFVSDYARFWILYNFGGIYLDTDVELIKPIDDIVDSGPFFGYELTHNLLLKLNDNATFSESSVAPGLGMASYPNHPFYNEILDYYNSKSFYKKDGNIDMLNVVQITTSLLSRKGKLNVGKITKIDDITIYPPEFFCPKDYFTEEILITNNTRSIHHYSATWKGKNEKNELVLLRKFSDFFGDWMGIYIWKLYVKSYKVAKLIHDEGIKSAFVKIYRKINKSYEK